MWHSIKIFNKIYCPTLLKSAQKLEPNKLITQNQNNRVINHPHEGRNRSKKPRQRLLIEKGTAQSLQGNFPSSSSPIHFQNLHFFWKVLTNPHIILEKKKSFLLSKFYMVLLLGHSVLKFKILILEFYSIFIIGP